MVSVDGVSIPPGPLKALLARRLGADKSIDLRERTRSTGMARSADDRLTPQQVADIFHVDPKTVARWARMGKLDFTTSLGGHRRYFRAQVEEVAATHLRSEKE